MSCRIASKLLKPTASSMATKRDEAKRSEARRSEAKRYRRRCKGFIHNELHELQCRRTGNEYTICVRIMRK